MLFCLLPRPPLLFNLLSWSLGFWAKEKHQKCKKKYLVLFKRKELLPTRPASRNETGSSFHIYPKPISHVPLSHRAVCLGFLWVFMVTAQGLSMRSLIEISLLRLQDLFFRETWHKWGARNNRRVSECLEHHWQYGLMWWKMWVFCWFREIQTYKPSTRWKNAVCNDRNLSFNKILAINNLLQCWT